VALQQVRARAVGGGRRRADAGPDVLSQVLMAGPLFGLYNISIIIVWIIERGRRKKLAELAKHDRRDLLPLE